MKKFLILSLFLASLFAFSSFPQGPENVGRIDIQGNKIVSNATIVTKIKIRAGQPYNENVVNDDVKNLYATGFFESVEVSKDQATEGMVLTFKVKEKPVLKKLNIDGARVIRKQKIEDAIEFKEGTFIDDYKLKETSAKIRDLYTKKGFSQSTVTYKLDVIPDKNEATVTFTIDEKGVVKVRKVSVSGNKHISSGRIIKLMKTRKAWLFNKGIFADDAIRDDVKRIVDYYKLAGYSDVKVDTEVESIPKGLHIIVKVQEGVRYYLGTIKVEGYKNVTIEAINKALKLKEGDVFSDQAVYDGSSRIREVYVDKGYIFSQIEPVSFYNPDTKKVEVTYKIAENNVAYVEKIDVRGNVRTKDKVIRRELRVYPQEKFDGARVRKSKERLENLGFFEEIRVETEPGSEQDNVNLIFDVKEAKTGYLSFGGGYSTVDQFVGFVELRQRNFDYANWQTFTGAGQDLSLYASAGSLTSNYELSFTNPWIFNRPISFGFDGYLRSHKRETDVGYGYDEKVAGGDLRLGKEFNDNLKGQIAYRLDNVKIGNVDENSTQDLKDEAGTNLLSSGEANISYDTRDNVFNPLHGIYASNAFSLTGGPFGGDKDFIKNYSTLSFFVPLVNKSVVELKMRAGFADPFSGTKKVPIYERFFAGGATTIRGYRERKVGPIDSATNDPLGGESTFLANVEYTYPLADFLKVATFFDSGNVWQKNSDFFSTGLFKSVGLGLRVKTPIGPISVDYGWPLDLEPGETAKEGRFHFNVSRGF